MLTQAEELVKELATNPWVDASTRVVCEHLMAKWGIRYKEHREEAFAGLPEHHQPK